MERQKNPADNKNRQERKPGQEASDTPVQANQDRNRGPERQIDSQSQEGSRGCDRPDELDEALDAENQ